MTFEDAVTSMQRQTGWDRASCEKVVRAQLPHLAPMFTEPVRDENAIEKAEQWAAMKLYRGHGLVVCSLSQPRATKQTPGIADLLVFAPKVQTAWWHEVKRPVGGEQSPAQKWFQQLCEQCGMRYVIGDRTVAGDILVETGLGIRIDNRIEPAHLYRPRSA